MIKQEHNSNGTIKSEDTTSRIGNVKERRKGSFTSYRTKYLLHQRSLSYEIYLQSEESGAGSGGFWCNLEIHTRLISLLGPSTIPPPLQHLTTSY